MIPLNPEPTEAIEATEPTEPASSMPTMEKDAEVVLESLKAREGVYLAALAKERYSDADSAQPGTLTYMVEITDDRPISIMVGAQGRRRSFCRIFNT